MQITKKGVILIALVLRLIAAIFSQGYGMHDDHFLVVEAPASWAHGSDYSNWLPWNQGEEKNPQGHSFTYIGLQYLFFESCEKSGITDPKSQMMLNRILHGLWSLLTVVFAMKIAALYCDRKDVIAIGLVISALWIMPFLSVRNLVETVTIPLLMICIYYLIQPKIRSRYWIMAGIMLGLAISIRYQLGVFAIGLGIALMIERSWKKLLYVVVSSAFVFVLSQSAVDYYIWGRPFAELMVYVNYNLETEPYIKGGWYMYMLVLMGAFLLPLGLIIFISYFTQWKKHLVIFLPTFALILFHTLHPNRQERFILPIIVLFFVLGYIGWLHLRDQKKWFSGTPFIKWTWIIFWALNIPALAIATTMYSKKSRVESAYYLNGKEVVGVVQDAYGEANTTMIPKFYADQYEFIVWHSDENGRNFDTLTAYQEPIYVFFYGTDQLELRVQRMEKWVGPLQEEKVFHPSFVDNMLYRMNPKNNNETIVVYKNQY